MYGSRHIDLDLDVEIEFEQKRVCVEKMRFEKRSFEKRSFDNIYLLVVGYL